ncbi:MAG: hypothetical protein GY792_31345 [Gammaproteobacteria bacterium]|nr:hypothetical protein [Gammaproteobacteria bacterium]
MMDDPLTIASSTDKMSPDASSAEATIALLVDSLTAIPEYASPFIPIYEALGTSTEPAQASLLRPPRLTPSRGQVLHGGKLLTLRALRTHSHLLRGCTDLARDETAAIHQVIVSCKQIFPTPLPALPLGF